MIATNTSKFSVGCGSELLRPGESCEVDDALADKIEQLGAGLLRVEDGKPKSAKAKLFAPVDDMASWTPARVRNWASKRGREDIVTALAGELREGSREALEKRLAELEESESA